MARIPLPSGGIGNKGDKDNPDILFFFFKDTLLFLVDVYATVSDPMLAYGYGV